MKGSLTDAGSVREHSVCRHRERESGALALNCGREKFIPEPPKNREPTSVTLS